jgi:hypothetical protein
MRTRTLALMLILGTPAAGQELSPIALGRIDAHTHFLAEAQPVLDALDRLNVTAVNVCVVDRHEKGYETVAPQHAIARRLATVSRGRLPWIATFDDAGFAEPGFAARTLAALDGALAEGAHGVKVYKSLGMELRDAKGTYLLPDDPAFEPMFAGLAAQKTTVYTHIAEPIAAWLPLDPKNPDFDYYRSNPAWRSRPARRALEGRDPRGARPRAREAPGAEDGGMPPRQHGGGCGRDRAALRPLPELRRGHRGPNRPPDAAAARQGAVVPAPIPQPRPVRDRLRLHARPGSGGDGKAPRARARARLGVLRDLGRRRGGRAEGTGSGLPAPVLRSIFRENALRGVPGIGTEPKPAK